ncbi:hypothetical protein [Pseudooceanicola aestuarii]|uniref:hypothetical protein n=1 Tax=Pseudooceanicola aestuarii TaxID=2697319 RepID=UPI0013D6A9D7|nr:hypothetical protein [Pseudooceanicola aestuarii]
MTAATFSTEPRLTKTRLFEGVWEGVLEGPQGDHAPDLAVTLDGDPLAGVEITAADAPGEWLVRVAVPVAAIRDGIQTVLITEAGSGAVLNSFAVLAGDSAAGSLQAEVDLLRSELDMLKRAFRRHCVETA